MESYLANTLVFRKLLLLFQLVGKAFLFIPNFYSVARRYVVVGSGAREVDEGSDEPKLEDEQFASETRSLLYLYGESNLNKSYKQCFSEFHDFTVDSGLPMASILATNREVCRRCNKTLTIEGKPQVVVIYHIFFGTYLGSRITKSCKKCKIYEHYGFWIENGKRQFDEHCLELDFLLSSEETAFDMSMLRECSSLLVVGAVPFTTISTSYNRRFSYEKLASDDGTVKVKAKRMKRDSAMEQKELLKTRQSLDHRRLEQGFLLYGAIEVVMKYKMKFDNIVLERNSLVEMVVEEYHKVFYDKWTDHVCGLAGCKNVLVLDGNMKNTRQVCSCTNIGEVHFDEMEGSIVIGCQNTPAKSSRFCDSHKDLASVFKDDTLSMVGECEKHLKTVHDHDDDILPLKILCDRETRQGKFYQILWSDGRESWVKEANLPKKVFHTVKKGQLYAVTAHSVKEFGQNRSYLREGVNEMVGENGTVMKSSGFAVLTAEDKEIEENGKTRSLGCGTEKGKHKCANRKTAGVLAFVKPCGIVIGVREPFGSESKSQVYGHLHTLFVNGKLHDVDTICYDDACHLKKFTQNPKRSKLTEAAITISTKSIVCDKFHFKNHVDKWCIKNCNPYDCDNLKDVNTEACEQLFSWLSRFSRITKHMNRWRFLFLMLYVLDGHNDDRIKKL